MTDGWFRNANGNLCKRYGPPPTPVARGNFPTPLVSSDTMSPLEHIDGKMYDSKAAFRAVTKAHGMVEVGNDPARLRNPTPPKASDADQKRARRAAVEKAVAQSGL